jgi:hypothetical protein
VSGEAAPETPAARCTNCGAIAPRNYCPECGQRVEAHIHSLWGFVSEATEALTHADSRLWRTLLALLLHPGFLTREFLAGRRARYLPPFRLYFVLSVALFLIASASAVDDLRILAPPSPQARAALRDAGVEGIADNAQAAGAPRGCTSLHYSGPRRDWIEPRLQLACAKMQRDSGHALGQAFVHNIPRAMFIFLPLLAAFMKLLYWRPRRYYVEHLLFLVHNHAFVFLVLSLLLLATAPALLRPFAGWIWIDAALVLYLPLYLLRAMHRVYGQGYLLTFVKFAALGCAYFASALLMIVLVALYSAVTL